MRQPNTICLALDLHNYYAPLHTMAPPEIKKMALKLTAPVKTSRVVKNKRVYQIKIKIGKQAAM